MKHPDETLDWFGSHEPSSSWTGEVEFEDGQTRKVNVSYERPPIPSTSMDWLATVDGQEENGPYGWGNSRWKALDDLASQLEEEEEK